MQHDPKDLISATRIDVRSFSDFKQDKVIAANRLSISQLSMASMRVTQRIIADEPDMKPRWFCLQVMSGREMAVEKILVNADVDVLVAKRAPYKVVRRGRQRLVPEAAVMRGYVLVRCLNIPHAIAGLLRVDGVIGIIGGAVGPWWAKDESVSKFKSMAEEGNYNQRPVSSVAFMVGEHVKVTDGPFASFPGTVTKIDAVEKFRISVEVSIFGRATPVELDIAQIEKL